MPSIFPLLYDVNYDIGVCTDCAIGIPFDWIQGHLKDNHGLRTTTNQILAYLDLLVPWIQSKDVANWIRTYSTIPIAIKGIPIVKGAGCSACLHHVRKAKSMQNHISSEHRD